MEGFIEKKLDAAIKSVTERLKREPGSADFHYGLAALLMLKGDFNSASHHLDMARRLGVDVRVLESWMAKTTQATEETT